MSEKIVFLDRDTIAPQVEIRRPGFDHDWHEYDRSTPQQALARLQGARIALNNKVPLRRETLQQLPDLRLIALAATGYDCIDLDACRDFGITVANIRGYAVNTVPEHVFALILALRRNLHAYHLDVAAGRWQEADQFCFFDHPIHDLASSNLVIVGSGSIGQSVAGLGRAFGMKVHFAGRKGADGSESGTKQDHVPFMDALALADVISLHCPLNESTRHLFSRDEFRAMSRKPLLINAARGGIVDEAALEKALGEGLIAGAGFDVSGDEPPRSDSPLMRLMNRSDFLMTPHVAWASLEAQQTLADQLIDNIENFQRGAASNVVT